MARHKAFDINKAIDNAIDVFWNKGYEGSSMQDLVDALGLSRSSIYETFGSKKDLFLVALDRYDDQANDSLTTILYEEGTAKELLIRFFNKVVEHTRTRSCFMVNSTLEMADHPDIAGCVNANMAKNERAFYQLLARATSNGEVKGNPNLRSLSQYLVIVMNGFAISAVTTDRQTLDNVISMVLNFLR